MTSKRLTRRAMLSGVSALGGAALLRPAGAQARELVANTFGGPWEAAQRAAIAVPFEQKTGAKVTFVSILAAELAARLKASAGGRPPVDVALLDEPSVLNAIKEGTFARLPLERIPNAKRVFPKYQPAEPYAVPIAVSVLGIAYNARKLKTAPQSWADLWNPEYRGRVGLAAPTSQLGTVGLLALAKLRGGDEGRIDPGFEAVKSLLPSVGAIAPSPANLQTLMERGEVDIGPLWNNNTLILKGKGTGIEFAYPREGGIAALSFLGLTRGASMDLGLEYLNQGLDPESQRVAVTAPYFLGPVIQGVAVPAELRPVMPSTPEDLERLVVLDWTRINPQRAEWISRWNREIRV